MGKLEKYRNVFAGRQRSEHQLFPAVSRYATSQAAQSRRKYSPAALDLRQITPGIRHTLPLNAPPNGRRVVHLGGG